MDRELSVMNTEGNEGIVIRTVLARSGTCEVYFRYASSYGASGRLLCRSK